MRDCAPRRYLTRFRDAVAVDAGIVKSDARLISAALAVKCAGVPAPESVAVVFHGEHCCTTDVGHTARPSEKYAYWARLMIEEFRAQVRAAGGAGGKARLTHVVCEQIVQERLLEIPSSVIVPKARQQVAEAQIGLLS